jgi:hypothetical protein
VLNVPPFHETSCDIFHKTNTRTFDINILILKYVLPVLGYDQSAQLILSFHETFKAFALMFHGKIKPVA